MRTWTVRGYDLCLGRRGDLGLWERPLDTRAVAPEVAPGAGGCLAAVGHCQIQEAEDWPGHLSAVRGRIAAIFRAMDRAATEIQALYSGWRVSPRASVTQIWDGKAAPRSVVGWETV